jgi:hypothetical protein
VEAMDSLFSPQQRSLMRSDLLDYASKDTRISGAAITGSAAADKEDRWSDIDLAFGVADAGALPTVLADWTAHMYQQYQAVHYTDIHAGPWIYRVFLLPGTLQVDLAFVPAAEFRPLASTFRLVSGTAHEALHFPPPLPAGLIGMGWLYALHARTAIARRQSWQAEYMISGARDQALALTCLRHDLPTVHARGIHLLPPECAAQFEECLVKALDSAELTRAFRAVLSRLFTEIQYADQDLAARLYPAFCTLSDAL